MDEGLEEKIKDIGAMFGITEIPDSISDLIGSLVDQQNPTQNDTENKICPNCEQSKEKELETDGGIDALKIMELVNKYQTARKSAEQDQNIQLLRALGPFLNKKKQKKIKNCETMLTIIKMI